MKTKMLFGMAMIAVLGLGTLGMAVADGGITASATIPASTCGIALSGSAISFSVTSPGVITYSTPSQVTVTNGGNVDGALSISGTDWVGASVGDVGGSVAWTTYEIYTGEWSSAYTLSETPTSIGTVSAGGSLPLAFGLTSPVDAAGDSYTQGITITSSC